MTAPDPDTTYPIVLGESMLGGRALIHTLRYEFIPASADRTRPSALTLDSSDKAVVDMQNQNAGAAPISFSGKYEPCKPIDCLLIYDGAKGVFRLEKGAASIRNLTHDRSASGAQQRLAALPTRESAAPPATVDIDRIVADSSDGDVELDMSGRPIVPVDDIGSGSDESFSD